MRWDYIWVYLALINLVAGVAFVIDKHRAKRKGNRVSERSLHLLELFGGWPIILLLMLTIHHKNSKRSYHIVTIWIAVLWLVAVTYIQYRL